MAIDNLDNPNRHNSTIVQGLRELAKLDSELPNDLIAKAVQLANFLNENNKQLVNTVDGIVKKKEYKDSNITWYKKHFLELSRLLSSSANLILDLMCNLMAQGNLVQLSWQNIIDGTGIKNKKSIKNAIEELLDNGCIAIKFPSDKRNATIYMVNPEIATVGKNLHTQYWELVSHDKFKKWCTIKNDITYTRDIVKRTDKGNKHKFTFGRMGPPSEETRESAKLKSINSNDAPDFTSAATTTPDTVTSDAPTQAESTNKDYEELPFNIHDYDQSIQQIKGFDNGTN